MQYRPMLTVIIEIKPHYFNKKIESTRRILCYITICCGIYLHRFQPEKILSFVDVLQAFALGTLEVFLFQVCPLVFSVQ